MSNELIKYNNNYCAKIFGLVNNNVICYFNSLVQSLMSITVFNEHLINNYSLYKNNNVVKEYLTIYKKAIKVCDSDEKNKSIFNAYNMLYALNSIMKQKKSEHFLHVNLQNDIHEGFYLLIDSIGENVETLFYNRYECIVKCLVCKQTYKPGNNKNYKEPPELFIDLTNQQYGNIDNIKLFKKIFNKSKNFDLDALPNSKESVENFIKCNIQVAKDYRCDYCGAQNNYNVNTKKVNENVVQIYKLVMLSEVITVLFKKYTNKKKLYFPTYLDFKSVDGSTLKYRIVSQIEHYGNINGGHYNAKCLRSKSKLFYKLNETKIKSIIKKIDKKLKDENLTDEEKNNYKIMLKKLMAKLDENTLQTNPQGVFLFDDEDIKYCQENFTPTENTYMVFYQCY